MRTVPTLELGEIATIQIGPFGSLLHKADYIENGVPVINPMHIAPHGISADYSFSVPSSKADELARYLLNAGEIIMGRRGEMGRCAIVEPEHEGMICGTGSMKIIPQSKRLNPEYLVHMIRTPKARAELENSASGVTMMNLNAKALANLKIPLPPLEEQKRIAGILDQADALRRLRTRALDKLNTLGQAIFHEMFGDVVKNSMGWADTKHLEDVADIASGITKGRKTGDAILHSVPYMAVSNVQDQHLKMDVVKDIEATESEIDRYLLKRGDLLLTEGGDPDKLGRGCLWNDEVPQCIHQNHVFRVRTKDEQVIPIFLQWLVGSQRGKRYFLSVAKQTTGIASINKTQLKRLPLLLPPIEKQIEFQTRITNLQALVAREAVTQQTFNALFASLQHRAFRGEL